MTQSETKNAAKQFAKLWAERGDEKSETHNFWIGLLHSVFGVENAENEIEFEKRVSLEHTSFIDGYIQSTSVLIEQKSIDVDIRKAYKQSDGSLLTPFQQAHRYAANLKRSEIPHWIVVCNFKEFLIYDMERPNSEPESVLLKDLEKDFYRLEFLVDSKNENLKKEEEISLKAGELVGKLYDSLYKQYLDPDANSLKSLNILCVRIVFCLYAEDAGLFESKTSFEDYIKSFAIENLRAGIIALFKALDTKLQNRDKYDTKLKPFPYVNGGLFRDEQIEIPNFSQEIVDVIIKQCAPFNWSEISPTIFGAVFESTLNPETRRKGGMHYTSVQNIHKVIDPLFMNGLNEEFNKICAITSIKNRMEALLAFQEKLGSLKFLDPACGSGNFLTETYLSLRRLENKVISLINRGEKSLGFDEFIKVHINQFYGIEINDFAVTVAKTALWIAESQMTAETEKIMGQQIDFLPLTTNAFIVEGNALRMNWSTLKAQNRQEEDTLFTGFTTQTDGTEHHYDYIMGNPPFVGAQYMSKDQKSDLMDLFLNNNHAGELDFVAGWYFKASQLIQRTDTRCAFVSTNSITQGEQVAAIWKPLFEQFGIHFDFAYRTFRWDSEATIKAHVHCVIIGFSCDADCHSELVSESQKPKIIYLNDSQKIEAKNINPYLIDADNVWIESRNRPICGVNLITKGCQPTDGGNLIIEAKDYDEFIKKEPNAKKFIKNLVGAQEFINNKKRYCLWLVDANPAELRKMPLVMERVEACREMRLKSSDKATRKLADTPTVFRETYNPKTFIIIPSVSSEKRSYIPIGFLDSNTIATNLTLIIPNATIYDFGILTSSVHNAWMRSVCGRLEMRYRYSKDIVYNNFPWPAPGPEQKAKIEQTARAILDARAKYPECSLADMYDETVMPADLRAAHRENDKAVMQSYGFNLKMTESECVAELFKLYEALVK